VEETLAQQRKRLPDEPGVYLFKNAGGEVIYVGKSVSIKKRVASHFSGKSPVGSSGQIEQVDFMVTATEAEALIVEQQFIRSYRPRFNIRLRDDKSYPYIGVSLDEEFPRVYFTREKHRRDRRYFGPYASPRHTRDTLELLGRLFQYRTCDGPEPGRRSGVPCLDYYIKRCQAPCVGKISKEEYRRNIDAIMDFLGGNYRSVADEIEQKMKEAAADHEFERAAALRDKLRSIQALMEKRTIATKSGHSIETADIVGVALADQAANAQVLQVRDGILAERQGFYLDNKEEAPEEEVIEQFLAQYYSSVATIPPLIVVSPAMAGKADMVAEALSTQRGSKVEVRTAMRGDKRRLRELAERNAKLALTRDQLRKERTQAQRVDAVSDLRERLGMENLPMRIEGFDISNLGATHIVASMVVFEGGAPKKAHYRKFAIRGVVADPDDFASMEEVLGRRVRAYLEQADLSPHDKERDESFASLPDLIMVDGGKGQLSAAMEVLGPLVERGTVVVSLAKRLEEIYVPGASVPLDIPKNAEGSRLLQRVRDEAHRFALTFHRQRRSRSMTSSIFDNLAGVGLVRKKALLDHFGTPEAFLRASADEIAAVPGIPGKLAREIHRQLHRIG